MPYSTVMIETERLFLRPICTADFEALCILDGDPEVRHYFPEGTLGRADVQQELDRYIRAWHAQGFGLFAAIEKQSKQFIGRCGFAKLNSGEVEFGYLFLPHYWKQGYATEASQALLAWAVEHVPVDHIIGFAPANHLASIRVLEKCGMQFLKMDTYRNIECVFYKFDLNKKTGLRHS